MKRFASRLLFCSTAIAAGSSLVGCATLKEEGDAKAKQDRARQQRDDSAPKVGDTAPLFTLKMLDDQSKTVKLASYGEKRPVVLFFGSYT